MKWIDKILIYLFSCLSIVIFIASLAGYLDRWHYYLEFTNNFKLQYLIISGCLGCFWLVTRRYLWFYLSLVCFALNLTFILPWYLPQTQQVTDTSYNSLRIFAFNVLHQNQRYQDAIDLVKNKRVDIAIFLEATPPWDRKLRAFKKIFPYHLSTPKLQIEIYSKYPLQDSKIELYGTYRGLVKSLITIDKSKLALIAAHAYPQLYYGQQGWQIRNQQLEKGMGSQLANYPYPLIVAGDFNVTMWSSQYRNAIAESGLKNARSGFGILPTQSNFYPQIPWLAIPLDHFLTSKDIIVSNMGTEANIGSDHLPIIMDVLVPEYN